MTGQELTKTRPFENPFSAKRLVPGAMPFVDSKFHAGQDCNSRVGELASQFLENGFGQIIGPHGSGKTTLAKAIIERMENVSSRFVVVRNQKSIETIQTLQAADEQRQLVVVDGVERIPLVHRVAFLAFVKSKRNRVQFMVTSHQKILGWPILTKLNPSLEQFQMIADQLMQNANVNLDGSDLARVYSESNQNYRNAFMKLYDLVQQPIQQHIQSSV